MPLLSGIGHGIGGSLWATPARETLSVHLEPSQYRYSNRPEGSLYQSAGTAGVVVVSLTAEPPVEAHPLVASGVVLGAEVGVTIAVETG